MTREKQANPEAAEGNAHALHHATQGDFDAFRNLSARDQAVDILRDGAQVLAERTCARRRRITRRI